MIAQLAAKKRKTTVKASSLRKKGIVPGCLYGKDMDSTPIEIQLKDLQKFLSKKAQKVELVIEGKKYLAGVEEIQKGNLQNKLVHVGFHALKQNEKATLTVPIELTGEAKGHKEGGVVAHPINEITIKGYPADLPDKISIDVSELELGDSIKVKDFEGKFPFEFLSEDLDKVFATCHYPKVQETETTVEAAEATETAETTITTDSSAEKTDESASKDAA
jgi:large subunit ribosomal protein L25